MSNSKKYYKNDDKVIVLKTLTLTISLLVLLFFSLFITFRNALAGSIFSDFAYVVSIVISIIFLVLNFKGYFRIVTISSAVVFTLLISLRFIFGPFRELNVIYFAIIIVATLFFTNKRVAYSIISFIFIFIIVHAFWVKDLEDFNSDYILFSLLALFLITIFCVLNMHVLNILIKRISKNRDELEEQVLLRTEDLKESKEYAEMLFHHSPCAIYTTDIDNNVVDFNNKAEIITGYSKREAVGKPFDIYCDKNCSYGTECCQENKNENECTIITKDGATRTIERHSSLFHDKKGAIIGNIESFIDLSDWRELEDFKIDIERIIRHDLKTPLNSIIGFPKMMIDDESISEENKKYLQIILNSGINMKNLIDLSQYLYKLEHGTFEVNNKETDLFDIIRQIDIDLMEIKQKKNCDFPVYFNERKINEKSELIISTEKTLLYMILSNLIKNALEASPGHNDITVKVKNEKNLTISVHNIGTIPREIRDSFFNKYVTFNKKTGTGLGTYSAKLMANAIGADINFKTDDDSGTELFLIFNS